MWRGRCAAVKLWKAGFAVICPHLNSFMIAISGVDEDEMVRLDCEIIRRCDFVVLLKGWERSKGAIIEDRIIRDRNFWSSRTDQKYINRHYDVEDAIYGEKG